MILFSVLFIASIILLCFFIGNKQKNFTNAIDSQKINPYTLWSRDINSQIIEEELFVEKHSRVEDYNRLKYYISGEKSIDLLKGCDIYESVIFNNPYTLSCGVWKSGSKLRKGSVIYNNYLPLIKIKTNSFLDDQIQITNSKDF